MTRLYRAGARRVRLPAVGGLLGVCLALSLLVTPSVEGRAAESGQRPRRPDPETYHWVLPAQHSGVEVVDLHPNDCYAIQRAEGMVYFGTPLPEVLELQRQLGEPHSHLVDHRDEHPECLLVRCLDVSRLRDAITARLLESGDRRDRRVVGHRPTPLDNMRGGVYSDVGSDDRPRYRHAPEQRMAYLHLGTAGRGNCYEAKVPRTLTIHIRDHQQRTDRTGCLHRLSVRGASPPSANGSRGVIPHVGAGPRLPFLAARSSCSHEAISDDRGNRRARRLLRPVANTRCRSPEPGRQSQPPL